MRPLGRWKRRVLDDRGFTIVEVCVAAFVLAVGVTTVIGSMGAGMGLVGHSRQRSAGAGVAQERLERARNVAYDDLALNEDPTHNNEATHPDHNVIENGPGPEDDEYGLDGGQEEPLIINTADGGLKHLDDPFTLAHTDFTVHQYVTWVDDPDSGRRGPARLQARHRRGDVEVPGAQRSAAHGHGIDVRHGRHGLDPDSNGVRHGDADAPAATDRRWRR